MWTMCILSFNSLRGMGRTARTFLGLQTPSSCLKPSRAASYEEVPFCISLRFKIPLSTNNKMSQSEFQTKEWLFLLWGSHYFINGLATQQTSNQDKT